MTVIFTHSDEFIIAVQGPTPTMTVGKAEYNLTAGKWFPTKVSG